MKNFIAWDKKSKKFRAIDSIVYDTNSVHDLYRKKENNLVNLWGENVILSSEDCSPDILIKRESGEFTLHEMLEVKDINNKRIYADSSIVEIERGDNIFYAYFSFDKKYLRYEICTFACNNFDIKEVNRVDFFYFGEAKFKIIDTIQENKLGLLSYKLRKTIMEERG